MNAILVLLGCIATVMGDEGYGSRCFDCNYAPSGYVKSGYGYEKDERNEVGTNLCIDPVRNADSLDKWNCPSGRCFIRKDPNGLIYRGCADYANLPGDVTPEIGKCVYSQNDWWRSLWYFCKGDLCNSANFGDVCGKPVRNKNNPCNEYACKHNPSGLFPNPDDHYNRSFIQCGCDFDAYGNACSCCRPFVLSTPKGTLFQAATRYGENPQFISDPNHKPEH